MSIFSTAIKTLSDVALQESTVNLPEETKSSLVEEVQDMLDSLPSLNENEMVFDVRMVPVRANPRLGKYLIEMEDISRYMITNKISSLREAVGNILECNDLEGEFVHVALVIDEASILSEMEDMKICKCEDYCDDNDNKKLSSQDNLKYIRRLANSKTLLDTLYNKYGIPFIKKNYNSVGLLDEESEYKEDVELKKKNKDKILHEKDVDNDTVNEDTVPSYNQIQPGDSNTVIQAKQDAQNGVHRFGPNTNTSSNPSTSVKLVNGGSSSVQTNKPMTENSRIQYLRDIASGKYDN